MATTFDFVAGDEFRVALQTDYAELEIALKNRCWKSVHVLAGSIVEAILIDYIVGSEIPSAKKLDPLTLDLAGAIKVCREEGILSPRAVSLSDVVRDYRNLIHPGRVQRLGESVDEQSASVAVALVDMVAKDVGKTRAETKGLTAEQLAGKLVRDATSVSILGHLVAELDKGEPERLLLKVLPEAYLADEEQGIAKSAVRGRLKTTYKTVYVSATTAVQKKAAQRYVEVLRQEVGEIVRAWETSFFQATMLGHLSTAEAGMVKAHLLANLKDDPSVELMTAAKGISRFLTAKEQATLVDAVVREIVYGKSVVVDTAARELLEDTYQNEPVSADKRLVERLQTWVDFLKGKGRPEDAETIEALRLQYDELSDLPF